LEWLCWPDTGHADHWTVRAPHLTGGAKQRGALRGSLTKVGRVHRPVPEPLHRLGLEMAVLLCCWLFLSTPAPDMSFPDGRPWKSKDEEGWRAGRKDRALGGGGEGVASTQDRDSKWNTRCHCGILHCIRAEQSPKCVPPRWNFTERENTLD
jgi:hypothetical protein